jgi:hypothetical protein
VVFLLKLIVGGRVEAEVLGEFLVARLQCSVFVHFFVLKAVGQLRLVRRRVAGAFEATLQLIGILQFVYVLRASKVALPLPLLSARHSSGADCYLNTASVRVPRSLVPLW